MLSDWDVQFLCFDCTAFSSLLPGPCPSLRLPFSVLIFTPARPPSATDLDFLSGRIFFLACLPCSRHQPAPALPGFCSFISGCILFKDYPPCLYQVCGSYSGTSLVIVPSTVLPALCPIRRTCVGQYRFVAATECARGISVALGYPPVCCFAAGFCSLSLARPFPGVGYGGPLFCDL